MQRTLLKSKLHRVTTTIADLNYEGSCAIDRNLLEVADIAEYEAVNVYNVTNGERFSTYAIAAERGSGTISVNGAAARKAAVGDILIIASFASYDEAEQANHQPILVYADGNNAIKTTSRAIAEQKAS